MPRDPVCCRLTAPLPSHLSSSAATPPWWCLPTPRPRPRPCTAATRRSSRPGCAREVSAARWHALPLGKRALCMTAAAALLLMPSSPGSPACPSPAFIPRSMAPTARPRPRPAWPTRRPSRAPTRRPRAGSSSRRRRPTRLPRAGRASPERLPRAAIASPGAAAPPGALPHEHAGQPSHTALQPVLFYSPVHCSHRPSPPRAVAPLSALLAFYRPNRDCSMPCSNAVHYQSREAWQCATPGSAASRGGCRSASQLTCRSAHAS